MVSIDNARVATCIVAAALAGASAVAFPSVARADDSSDPASTLPLPDMPAAATATAGAAMGDEGTDALADAIAAALDPAGVVDGAAAESPDPSPEPVAAASVPEAAPSADPAPTTGSAPEQPSPAKRRYQGACGRYHRRYRLCGRLDLPLDRDVSPRSRRPVRADQRERQRSHRQPRGQRRGHAGEHRRGGRHRCEQRGSHLIHGARIGAGSGTQLTVHGRESASNGDIVAGFRDELGRRPRSRHVGVAMGLPVRSAVQRRYHRIVLRRDRCRGTGRGSGTVAIIQPSIRGGTASQYQPVNMNVSIRISSPGNDGPVSQSNVAIAVGAGRTSPDGHTPAGSSPSPSPPVAPGASFPGIPSLPPIASLPGLSSLPAVLSPVVSVSPSLVEGGGVSGLVVGAALSFGDEPVELPFVLPGLGGDGTPWLTGVGPIRGGAIADVRMGEWASGTGSRLGPAIVGAAGRSSSIEAAATSSKRSDAERRAKPAPRWRTPVPTSPAPASAPVGASAAASTGGGSSGGGLPVFLALPFLVALLDLARRVALERAASPSEHRSRMPDTPGVALPPSR